MQLLTADRELLSTYSSTGVVISWFMYLSNVKQQRRSSALSFHVRPDHLLSLADRLDSDSTTVMVFIYIYIQPFPVNIRETECPYSLVTAHLSKAHPLTIWISFSESVGLPCSRYFDRGSIWFKLTHFVRGNRSRETEEGETGKAAAALIPLTGSVKSAFHKGCSPVMSPPEWQIGPRVL